MSLTRVAVHADVTHGGVRVDLAVRAEAGAAALRPRILDLGPRAVRVALVQAGALLLAGDSVRIEVVVGDGTTLEVVEPTGTVAYGMRGGSATLDVDVPVAPRGTLLWNGEPFVVADGAHVRRAMTCQLAEDGAFVLHETLVLGRAQEQPGRLDNRLRVVKAGRPVLAEDLTLGPQQHRAGVLGDHRVIESDLEIAPPEQPPVEVPAGAHALALARGGTLWRRLGAATHENGLSEFWDRLICCTAEAPGYARSWTRGARGREEVSASVDSRG